MTGHPAEPCDKCGSEEPTARHLCAVCAITERSDVDDLWSVLNELDFEFGDATIREALRRLATAVHDATEVLDAAGAPPLDMAERVEWLSQRAAQVRP